MKFESEKLNDFEFSRSLEWVETNGVGGYASGTVSGAHTRKYHGLLVAALHPPVARMVVVSKLEETIVAGHDQFELNANQYVGAVHPKGYQYLTDFTKDLFPEFTYQAGGFIIKKTIAALSGENTTIILYEVLDAPKKFTFELLPLYAYRDFHSLSHNNDSIRHSYTFENGTFQTSNYNDCPEFFITIPGTEFVQSQCWYYNFEYSGERDRGLAHVEDLYSHGKFKIELKKGSKVGVILSMELPGEKDAFKLFQKEKKRRENIAKDFSWHENLKRLVLAADQFIVKRGDFKTVIAGYHWFSDWGRDTMISLEGLCLVTERFEDAKNILNAFASNVSEGMLPNRFTDYDESPKYNTIDATLWYFNAIYKYYQYTKDKIFVTNLIPVLRDIIEWHERGTRYNIHVDPDDGLIYGGQEGVQLTWMDAKVGNWVVTPRIGKPVEINALWYNALCCMDFLTIATGTDQDAYKTKAAKVHQSFNNKFWNEDKEFLYDVINREHKDDSIRPNAIFAISLPYPVLTGERALKIFKKVEKELLTPRGIRTLDVNNANYRPTYEGDLWHRDGAYHQGTVWSYLLGAYIDALIQVDPKGKEKAKTILDNFFSHLDEAGVGSISEIFDGNTPHHPRGCVAQAWAVAEIFRVAMKYDLYNKPTLVKNPL